LKIRCLDLVIEAQKEIWKWHSTSTAKKDIIHENVKQAKKISYDLSLGKIARKVLSTSVNLLMIIMHFTMVVYKCSCHCSSFWNNFITLLDERILEYPTQRTCFWPHKDQFIDFKDQFLTSYGPVFWPL